MYFKRKMRRGISTALIAAMTVGNALTVSAAPVGEWDHKAELLQGNGAEAYGTELVLVNDGVEPDNTGAKENGPKVATEDQVKLVIGETAELTKPEGFSENVTWSTKFRKYDGTYLRNVGFSKIKRELKEGERDGDRVAGDATADHLLAVEKAENGNAQITAKHKGEMVVVASDDNGNTKQWDVKILHVDPSELPEVTAEDYARIRRNWKESLIGTNLLQVHWK